MAYRSTTSTPAARLFGIVALIVLLALAALPFTGNRALMQELFSVLILLTLAQFWNLLAGYGGLVSVGQQAFVGLGGYALFGLTALLGLNAILTLPLAGLIALVIAVPMAWFAFRLNGAYFAIATWVMAEVLRLSLAQWKALGGGTGTSLPRDVVGGTWGLDAVTALTGLRAAGARDALSYWLALILAAGTIAGIYALLRSRAGLALSAVRDNEVAASAVGVDANRIKWLVYLTAAFGTGVVGALVYLQIARISPDAAFSVTDWTAYVIFIVVIGGIGTIEGPIVGVIVFAILQYTLSQFGSWYLITLGAIAILTMLFAPRGLWGAISARTGLHLFPVRRRLTRV